MATSDTTQVEEQPIRPKAYVLRYVEHKDFGYPKIEIPDFSELTFDQWRPSFQLGNGDESLDCRFWKWGMQCSGSITALAQRKLIRPEWLPGIPGNNKTRQTVLFTDNGPALAIGKCHASQVRKLVIARQGHRVVVEFEHEPDIQPQWEKLYSRWESRRDAQRARKETRELKPDYRPILHDVLTSYASTVYSPARFLVGDECMFCEESSKDNGDTVEIISEYGYYSVRDHGWLWGYRGKFSDGKEYFLWPHQLRELTGRSRHIRLVQQEAFSESSEKGGCPTCHQEV